MPNHSFYLLFIFVVVVVVAESDREGQQKERHPPGLRGREIGMWYARRSKARVVKEQKLNVSKDILETL